MYQEGADCYISSNDISTRM